MDSEFVKALVDDALVEGNSDFIEELRDKAKAAISKGAGLQIVSVSENGKSWAYGPRTHTQMFAETTQALLAYLNGGFITVTTPDFSGMGQ